MSWLSKALGISSSQDPSKAAMPYLSQIPGVGHQYYDPYISQGQQAGQTLQGEYAKQLDPAAFMEQLQSGYKPSGAYGMKKDELERGMRAMGASGGYGGTPEHLRQYGQASDELLSGDMQQYLQNALNIYGQGISGEQDIYGKGYGASGSMADMLGSNLAQQGGLAYQGQQSRNQGRQALINSLMKVLGQGGAAGAGYAAGGWQGASNAMSGGM